MFTGLGLNLVSQQSALLDVAVDIPDNIHLVNNDDMTISPWAGAGTISIAGGVSDPDGGTDAYTLTAGSGFCTYYQVVSGLSAGEPITVTAQFRRRTGSGAFYFYYPDILTFSTLPLTGAWAQATLAGQANGSGVAQFRMMFQTSGDEVDVYDPRMY